MSLRRIYAVCGVCRSGCHLRARAQRRPTTAQPPLTSRSVLSRSSSSTQSAATPFRPAIVPLITGHSCRQHRRSFASRPLIAAGRSAKLQWSSRSLLQRRSPSFINRLRRARALADELVIADGLVTATLPRIGRPQNATDLTEPLWCLSKGSHVDPFMQ